MRTEIVHSVAGLRAALDSMGRPSAGRVRVFRGQTREYKDKDGEPLLLPSLSRRSGAPMYDPAWLGAMMSYVAVGGEADLARDFVTLRVWAPALVQHYGPGSHYLDVSHDLDVALWFATHDYIERWFMVEGNPREQLPDAQYAVAWSSDVDPAIARADQGGPIIYVFDIEPWDGRGLPNFGQLVDLLALEPIRHLLDNASRLNAQSAALLFAEASAGEDSGLRSKVAGRIYLAADFDLGEVADLKWVGDIYPGPGADPLYKALLEFPAYLQFEPLRLEQPLAIPFQLTRELPFGNSPNVGDLGGDGTYARPKRLKFGLRSGPDLHVVAQVQDYLSLGHHMEPPLLHAWLLENGGDLREAELGGKRFRLEDALPLFLESPLWKFMPGVSSPRDLGMWIQSALPHGIADAIGGRSTASAYVEMCPLDIFQPGHQPGSQDLMRAIWVVRDALDYAVVVFRKGQDVYSFCVRYRYNPESGSFERQDLRGGNGADATLAGVFASTLKALFVTLTVLRDLSPGYKPPPSFSLMVGDQYLPMPLLEPQLAKPRQAPASPYVVPKALDGSRYLRASGKPRDTPPVPEDPAQARHWLEHYLPLVKAPQYRAFATQELARLKGA